MTAKFASQRQAADSTGNIDPLLCDVLVIGSGASGLSAAVTAAFFGLDVVVAEKEPLFGGTTAISGGWLWIPRNPLARAGGITETIDGPMQYLREELGAKADDPRIARFLANGPEMVSFFAEHTAVQWIGGNHVPDFHDQPGAVSGGRSVSVPPFDGRLLGPWISRLRPPLDAAGLWGMAIQGGAEMTHFFNATRRPASALVVARRLLGYFGDLLRHRRDMHLINGNALIARLMRSALDQGVTLLSEAPATQLLMDDGRVQGALLSTSAGQITVRARRGVVLAAGGFPHDRDRLANMAPHAGPDGRGHYSAAPAGNRGDGLRLGEVAGGAIADDLASPLALAPVSQYPQADGSVVNFPHLVERAKPGFIAVTPQGRRFVNEADSYYDFTTALLEATPAGQEPQCWLIADHRAQRRWGLGAVKPFPFPVGPAIRSGYLKSGRTIAKLAAACGIDAAGLEATLEQFNAAARRGEDPQFQRGQSRYNQVQGDLLHRPNASLAPLETAPFYAVRLLPGSLGTFAGLRTDDLTRVLDQSGVPIEGLHAVGNDMASIMGGHYPSGGITLGPGMTFGYVAGRVLAGQVVTGTNKDKDNELLRAGNA